MDVEPVLFHKLLKLIYAFALVPHIGEHIHQKSVARRGCKGIYDIYLPVRIFFLKIIPCYHRGVYYPGYSG